MQLRYYSAPGGNVGDDINRVLWSHYCTGIEKSSSEAVLIGVGSILDRRFDRENLKVVLGAGARTSADLPVFDASWDLRFVRGPQTSEAIKNQGIDAAYITDP